MDPYEVLTNPAATELQRVRAIQRLRDSGATYPQIIDRIEVRARSAAEDSGCPDVTLKDAYQLFDKVLDFFVVGWFTLLAAGTAALGFCAGYLWTALIVKGLLVGRINTQYVVYPDTQVWANAVVSMVLWLVYGYTISELSPFGEQTRKRIKIWSWPAFALVFVVQRLF